MKQTNIFDFLIESMSDTIDSIIDSRKQRTNLKYSMNDIVLSAFSVFSQRECKHKIFKINLG
jgi:hypothetical protein